MENRHEQKLQTLHSGFLRYYTLRQLHRTQAKKVNILVGLCSTMQILTLMIPLREDDGYPWCYSTFWPIWFCLNAIARPDRLLEVITSGNVVVYLCAAAVGLRAASALGWIWYYGALRKNRYWRLAKKKNRLGCIGTYFTKGDFISQFAMSRLLAIPCISFLASSLFCQAPCTTTPKFIFSAILLPVAILLILADRVFGVDLEWKEGNEGPIKPYYEAVFVGGDLVAAVMVPMCSFLSHDVILRVVIFLCGGTKLILTYRELPFHSYLRNLIESFQGLFLMWEVVLLTLAVNVVESQVAPAMLVLLGCPVLFMINAEFVKRLETAAIVGHINSEWQHGKALQIAIRHPTKPEENEDSLKQHPRLGRLWLHQMNVHPLIWTAYYFLINGEGYFAKVAVTLVGAQPRTFFTRVVIEVCIARSLLQFEESPDELAIQNFLTLNKISQRIQQLDYETTIILRNYYQNLVRKTISFEHLVNLSQKLSLQLKKTISLYRRSIETFPKKMTLLQTYSSFLHMVGKESDSDKYNNMVVKLSQTKRKRASSGIDRLILEDPKCVIFVVPLSGLQKGQIVWAVNADAIGYTDDNIRGLDHNVLIPDMFKEMHNGMESGLIKKRSVPSVLLTSYKMFIVNKDKELLFGTWKVFGTNERGTADLIIIASLRLESPPKEFGIIGQYGGLMECTQGFAAFVRETDFLKECNMHSKDIVWRGEWTGTQLLVSKDEWNVANHQKVPCVSLFRMRNRGSMRGTLGRARLPMDIHSNQFSSNQESSQVFLSRASRATIMETGKSILLGSGEIGYNTQMMISGRLQVKRQHLARYQKVLMLTLILTFVFGSAVMIAVGQTFSTQVMELNATISSITSIGMRMLAIKAAIRSKELYLINTGFKLYGNETKAREELQTISSQFKDMRSYLRGNISSAIGTFRELLLDPITPFWRYEEHEFRLYMMPLLDLMDEISRRSLDLSNSSLANVTTQNNDFMTLYRNGAAEALGAFNRSVAMYAESKSLERMQRLAILELISMFSPLICLSISLMIVSPLLCLFERWRRRLWRCVFAIPKSALAEMLEIVHSRLATIHSDENDMFDSSPSLSFSHGPKPIYKTSTSMKLMITIGLIYCIFVSVSGLALYYYGQNQMENTLLHKPRYIDWHGMRRAMTVKSWFHMREAWLPASLSYSNIIQESQPFYSHIDQWEVSNIHLGYLHHCICYGCKQNDMRHLFPSDAHKDLLYGKDTSVPDISLQAGLTPLISELVQLSSAARTDLRSNQTSDYSKGKKIEKYTSLLLPSLTLSNLQFDNDTKLFLTNSVAELQQLCIATVCVFFAVLLFFLFPIVRTVR